MMTSMQREQVQRSPQSSMRSPSPSSSPNVGMFHDSNRVTAQREQVGLLTGGPRITQCSSMLQRRAADGASFDASEGFGAALQRTQGTGQALPDTIQREFGSKFGADFSGVRVHTGTGASSLNDMIQAQAFTQGSNIYFRDGAYDTSSTQGKTLLAHELTHTIQQGAVGAGASPVQRKATPRSNEPVPFQRKWRVGASNDKHEQEADRVAAHVMRMDMGRASSHSAAPPQVTMDSSNEARRTIRRKPLPLLHHTTSQFLGSTKSEDIRHAIDKYNKIEKSEGSFDKKLTRLGGIVELILAWQKKHEDKAGSKQWQEIGMVSHAAVEEINRVNDEKIIHEADGVRTGTRLPEFGYTTSQLLGKTKSEKFKKLIDDYNKLGSKPGNYHEKLKILAAIKEKGNKWHAKHAKEKRSAEKELIFQDRSNEMTAIMTRAYVVAKKLRDARDGGKDQEDLKMDAVDHAMDKGVSATELPDATSLGSNTKQFMNHLDGTVTDENLGKAKEPDVTEVSKYSSFVDTVAKIWSKVSPFLGLVMAVRGLVVSILEKKALAKAMKAKDEAFAKVAKYGHAKVRRRFYTTIVNVVYAVIDVVAFILSLTGVGALLGGILALGKRVISGVEKLYFKLKGVVKALILTRGEHRREAATEIVAAARKKNPDALQLLIDLDPVGYVGRLIGKGNMTKVKGEQALTSKHWYSRVTRKPETHEEMSALLNEMSKYENGNLNDFTVSLAEQLKSR